MNKINSTLAIVQALSSSNKYNNLGFKYFTNTNNGI